MTKYSRVESSRFYRKEIIFHRLQSPGASDLEDHTFLHVPDHIDIDLISIAITKIFLKSLKNILMLNNASIYSGNYFA